MGCCDEDGLSFRLDSDLHGSLTCSNVFAHLRDTSSPFHTAVPQEETWIWFTVVQLIWLSDRKLFSLSKW